ncbi:RDD family protein [Paroceanicella profunda]|uniref:RDD family protein n=1 Tax=Paroceanicella profunda TaxID=2579971 RepID=A0A5B8G2K9_9RHOB|nr:RDD family protein [Paroceanicella profunda]QDL92853.1 RDD family protein [Paroceanicella profunda]
MDGLPDPDHDPQFYDGVPLRRFIAWIIDIVIVGVLTTLALFVLALPSLGLIFFISLGVWAVIDFLYRVMTLSGGSATLGMRMMGIEIRTVTGDRLTSGLAVLHTALYLVCYAAGGLLQIASVVLMVAARPGRGIPDFILGTAAINRPV